jgi:hypothetical protein
VTVTTVAWVILVVSALGTLASAVGIAMLNRTVRATPHLDDAIKLERIATELSEISSRLGSEARRRA